MQGESWMKSSCVEKVKWATLLVLVALLGGGSAQTVEVCDLNNIIDQSKSVYLSISTNISGYNQLSHILCNLLGNGESHLTDPSRAT